MNVIRQALYSKLSSDQAILTKLGSAKIYHQVIPQGVSLPAIRFFYGGGGEENLTPTRSFNMVYAVVAVSSVSAKEAGEIADLVDAALHDQVLTVSGWSNQFWTARGGLVSFHELGAGGESYWHEGAYYRIRASQG